MHILSPSLESAPHLPCHCVAIFKLSEIPLLLAVCGVCVLCQS